MTELRVLSYNIRSLRDSAADVATVIRAAAADVVCIQEAPRFLHWRRKNRQLAADTGLRIVTGGRAAGAMVLLARPGLGVLDRRNVKLPKRWNLHQRGLAIGVVDVAGTPVTVASTHWSLNAEERLEHLPVIRAYVEALEHPAVIAGDINETPDGPGWAELVSVYQDAFAVAPAGPGNTYSAKDPHKRIDGVFADQRLTVVSCTAFQHPAVPTASDHVPVLAILEIAAREPSGSAGSQ